MSNQLKSRLRDVLPNSWQVPAKYWFGRIRGSLESEMMLLDAIVKKDDRVVDVGGNRGVYAYRLWALGATVEVFEPNPICFDVLSSWANGKQRVRLHSVALSSREGSANLHIPIDENGVEHDASASIENVDFKNVRDQVVELRTLDSYRFDGVSLVKIDVEGHEFGVIDGAAKTLVFSKPALLVEIEQRHNEMPINQVFDRILKLGYSGFFLSKGALVSLDRFNLAEHQSIDNFAVSSGTYINNFIFLHHDRVAEGEYDSLLQGLFSK